MTAESGSTDINYSHLVKEELKWTIKYRRRSQGKEEIFVDLSPPVQMAPSAEDLAVKKERQTRNNDAARKYRRKLRLKQMRVEKEHDKQMELNKKLKEVIQQVWHQRGELLLLLQQHVRVCKVGPLLRKSKQFLQQVYQDMAKVDKTVESYVGLNLVANQSMPSVNPASPYTESIPTTMANHPMPSVNPAAQFTGIIPTTMASQPMPSVNPASPFTESISTTIVNQPMPSVNPTSPFIANSPIITATQPMPSMDTGSSFTGNIPTTMANQPKIR